MLDPSRNPGEISGTNHLAAAKAQAAIWAGLQGRRDLRGSLGLGKVELAGSWVPLQALSSLPCPRDAGAAEGSARGALLSPGEEEEGCQSATSAAVWPEASCPPP